MEPPLWVTDAILFCNWMELELELECWDDKWDPRSDQSIDRSICWMVGDRIWKAVSMRSDHLMRMGTDRVGANLFDRRRKTGAIKLLLWV